MNSLLAVAVVLAAVMARTVQLYVWPFAPCRWCSGSGRNPGSNSRRFGNCRRCKGSGRRQRLGARTVHKAAQSAWNRKSSWRK